MKNVRLQVERLEDRCTPSTLRGVPATSDISVKVGENMHAIIETSHFALMHPVHQYEQHFDFEAATHAALHLTEHAQDIDGASEKDSLLEEATMLSDASNEAESSISHVGLTCGHTSNWMASLYSQGLLSINEEMNISMEDAAYLKAATARKGRPLSVADPEIALVYPSCSKPPRKVYMAFPAAAAPQSKNDLGGPADPNAQPAHGITPDDPEVDDDGNSN